MEAQAHCAIGMTKEGFERLLDSVVATLRDEARHTLFASAKQFENRVREVVKNAIDDPTIKIDFDPHPQAFPDIAVGEFGIEVKFTTNDTSRIASWKPIELTPLKPFISFSARWAASLM
jgi:hypothetical protein